MADEIKITSNFTEILAEVRKAMQGYAAESGATKAEMRTITSMAKQLMKQQESALRVANRSGQIHEARLKEIERHAQMVQSNLRVRAALRDDSGGGGGVSMGGMGIPFGKQMDEIKDLLQKTVGFG